LVKALPQDFCDNYPQLPWKRITVNNSYNLNILHNEGRDIQCYRKVTWSRR